ncbi:MAG: alanine--tRNA ligase [Puniceicoccales bacterium]|jgi:alanyl-tRNA synthetase|nr:alanine--tRNA ligase [Puniceicoccales bacterium]
MRWGEKMECENNMNSTELRQSFLDFFREKGHKIVPSASLLPESPNLLFTNAGMNQFVPILLGERAIQFSRAADTQKCIRAGGKHNDLEDVGFDTYHHTFFEMLGNWSFGDYFKGEAIAFAWELLAKVWHFPKERLYVTVYSPNGGDPAEFDREAYDYWERIFKEEGLDAAEHILKFGKKENFWMMGDTGPCGPCSEIHIDLTEKGDSRGRLVNRDSPLCMEIWNLVFMQFNAQADGTFAPLRNKHVDTGMGLERVAGIIETTDNFSNFSQLPSNYESDLFTHIFNKITALCGKIYRGTVAATRESMSDQEKIDFAFRVIADHIRALTFAIGDGILPGNEGRHYVLRRILRRAIIFAKRLQFPAGHFATLAETIMGQMAATFPELQLNARIVLETIAAEEAMFEKTLERGILLLEDIFFQAQNGEVSGRDAFTLYDTYGFPFDLTQLMAKERKLKIDEKAFQDELEMQRERARNAQKKSRITVADEILDGATQFVGYEQLGGIEAKVLQIIPREDATFIAFDRTPFYGEMGGEVGDSGTLFHRGQVIPIGDTLRSAQGIFLHKIPPNVELIPGEKVVLTVDILRRKEIQRHHTATHLMHGALRKILGDRVRQCGSYVGDRGLRFDFNHFAPLAADELFAVEDFVNAAIMENLPVRAQEMPFKAIPTACIAHFNEKYGEVVRVLSIGEISMELCGGCHASSTGELGIFKIVKESAIAAGVRRMEAVVGHGARDYVDRHVTIVNELAQQFSAKNDEILIKVQRLQRAKNMTERRLRAILEKNNRKTFDEVCRRATHENGLKKVRGIFEIENPNDLRSLGTLALQKESCDAVIFAGNLMEGAVIVVSCSPRGMEKNCDAAHMAQQIAEKFSGKGGGSSAFGMVNVAKKLEEKDLENLKF